MILLTLGLAATLSAESAEPGSPALRRQLDELIVGLGDLPGFDQARVADARQRVAAMTPEELELVAGRLDQLPSLRRLPEVLHNLEELKVRHRQQLVASFLDRRMRPGAKADPAAESERFKTELRFFVDRLRAFSPVIADATFDARLDRLAGNLEALPAEALPELRKRFYSWAPGFKARLRSTAARTATATRVFGPPVPNKLVFDSCDGDCSFPDVDCFIDEIECDINEAANQVSDFLDDIVNFASDIFSDISDFFTQTIPDTIDTIGDFFTELGTDLLALLEDFLDLLLDLLPDAEELLELLGMDFDDLSAAGDFFVDLVTEDGVINLPCPSIGTDIPGYGTVGSPRAEYVCKRGIDWVAGKVYDLIPDDSSGAAIVIAKAVLYYPIKYFCMCMEAQSQLCFADSQATHRQLADDNFDAVLSTRATQTSVDALQVTVSSLDAAIADVQADVDDLDADVAVVAGELVVVDGKVDDLSSAQGEQEAEVEALLSLETRLDIEENLLAARQPPEASFQFPEDAGGFLEVVAGIVEETIAMTMAAGERVGEAELWWAQGNSFFNEGAFEKAYAAYRSAYQEAVESGAQGPTPPPLGGH